MTDIAKRMRDLFHLDNEWNKDCGEAAQEIEGLRTILREAEHLASAEKGNLCARIIHMKDEIEGLRADLAAANDNHEHMVEEWKAAIREIERLRAEIEIARSAIGQLYRERDEAYERAAQTCEIEAIDLEYSEHREVDFPYNQAVKDCAMAIRALKSGEPK